MPTWKNASMASNGSHLLHDYAFPQIGGCRWTVSTTRSVMCLVANLDRKHETAKPVKPSGSKNRLLTCAKVERLPVGENPVHGGIKDAGRVAK